MGAPTASATTAVGQTEINWDKLNKTKFYVVGAGLFTGVTVALYPVSVVKTRLQVASKDVAERNAFSVIKGILRTDGIPGLYRGFGTVITGAVPARIIFLTALETTKVAAFKMVQPFKLSEPTEAAIANGIAGMIASLFSQSVFVPIDVVSQKLMVQGYSGHAKYNGGLDVARKILKSDGIRGFYRGFGLSVMTYSPSSAVWWASYGSSQRVIWSQKLMVQGYSGHAKYNGGLDVARKILKSDGIQGFYRGFGLSVMTYSPSSAVWWASYGSSQRVIWSLLGQRTDFEEAAPSQSKIVLVQATGGIIAGATASCITTPLDTIKTRLQVMGHEKRNTARQVVKGLIMDEGWKGLYRGLGPRFFSMSAWGTSMILAYEYLNALDNTVKQCNFYDAFDKYVAN
ncbi:solute carrier family 25 member 44 [Quercus suber]|uniref:Solute carrier family 25 member 44 n=1 Tax=Quercus suber TaxID=58331 RepID=A0AAW0L6Q1_QUESU